MPQQSSFQKLLKLLINEFQLNGLSVIKRKLKLSKYFYFLQLPKKINNSDLSSFLMIFYDINFPQKPCQPLPPKEMIKFQKKQFYTILHEIVNRKAYDLFLTQQGKFSKEFLQLIDSSGESSLHLFFLKAPPEFLAEYLKGQVMSDLLKFKNGRGQTVLHKMLMNRHLNHPAGKSQLIPLLN